MGVKTDKTVGYQWAHVRSVRVTNHEAMVGENLSLEVVLMNKHPFLPLDVRSVCFMLEDGSYFQESCTDPLDLQLERGQSSTFHLTMEANPGLRSMMTLPESVQVKLVQYTLPEESEESVAKKADGDESSDDDEYDDDDDDEEEGVVLMSIAVNIPLEPFVRFVQRILKQQRVKAMMYGLMGSCKSSVISTFGTTWNLNPETSHAITSLAFSAATENTLTRYIEQFNLRDMDGSVGLILLDLWGIELSTEEAQSANFTTEIFQAIVRARAGHGQSLDDALGSPPLFMNKGDTSKVDIVLITLPATGYQNTEMMDHYLEALKIMQKEGVEALVLLTMPDMIDPTLKSGLHQGSAMLTKTIAEVEEKTGIQSNMILPIINYTEERERTWAITHGALAVLWQMMLQVPKVRELLASQRSES